MFLSIFNLQGHWIFNPDKSIKYSAWAIRLLKADDDDLLVIRRLVIYVSDSGKWSLLIEAGDSDTHIPYKNSPKISLFLVLDVLV